MSAPDLILGPTIKSEVHGKYSPPYQLYGSTIGKLALIWSLSGRFPSAVSREIPRSRGPRHVWYGTEVTHVRFGATVRVIGDKWTHYPALDNERVKNGGEGFIYHGICRLGPK
jgi:hypothetical protein